MATILTSTKRPVGAKLDPVPSLRSTSLDPAPKLQPAALPAAKVITGSAVSQPAQPQPATQQPSPGQQAQAAPKPAPTWRAGNSVSNGYERDRASELFQKGMSATQAAQQAAIDNKRMAAAWKQAPKVDPKTLVNPSGAKIAGIAAADQQTGPGPKINRLTGKPFGWRPGDGVTAPSGVTAKPAASKAAVAVAAPQAKAAAVKVAPSPTKMATPAERMRSSVASPVAKPAVNPMPSPTKMAAPGERFRSPMAPAATKAPAKAAAVALPTKRGLQDRMTSNFMGPDAKPSMSVKRQTPQPAAPSQPATRAGFWRTLGNSFSGFGPNSFEIPEEDRKGYRVNR